MASFSIQLPLPIAVHGIDVINISLREFRDTKAAHALSIEILPFKVLEIFITSPLESRSKSSHVCNYEGHWSSSRIAEWKLVR